MGSPPVPPSLPGAHLPAQAVGVEGRSPSIPLKVAKVEYRAKSRLVGRTEVNARARVLQCFLPDGGLPGLGPLNEHSRSRIDDISNYGIVPLR